MCYGVLVKGILSGSNLILLLGSPMLNVMKAAKKAYSICFTSSQIVTKVFIMHYVKMIVSLIYYIGIDILQKANISLFSNLFIELKDTCPDQDKL